MSEMPMGTTSMVGITVGLSCAGVCLAVGQVVAPMGIPDAMFQFGALGIVGLVVFWDRKERVEAGKMLNERSDQLGRLTEKALEAIERNTKAIEGCLNRQKEKRT